MKPIEIAEKIKNENEEQLGKMNEKKIALIIRKALEEIKKEIEENKEGRMVIAGLGVFNTRMIEREVEGTKETVKRIMFKPAKAK